MSLLQNDLHLLVHSLSKAEKAYIRQLAGNEEKSRQSAYMLLLSELEKVKNYDEKAFLKKHAQKPFAKNFRFSKHYLYHFILDALHRFHEKSAPPPEVAGMIHRADILFNKGMFRQSFQLLEKAIKICEEKELFAAAAEACNRQYRNIIKGGFQLNNAELIASVCEKEQTYAAYLLQYATINLHKSKLMSLLRHKGNDTDKFHTEIKQTIAHIKALKPAKSAPSKITIQWQHSLATAHFALHDFRQAEKYLAALLLVYEQFPERKNDEPFNYLAALNNYAMLLLELNNWKKFEQTLQRFQPYLTELDNGRTPQHVLKAAESAGNLRMRYLLTRESISDAFIEKEMLPFLEKHAWRIGLNQQLNFYFHLACYYFKRKQFSKAQQALMPVLHQIPKDIRTDIHLQARILEMLVHYELNNRQLLPYLVDTIGKKINGNEKYHHLFHPIRRFLNSKAKDKTEALAMLKSEIAKLAQSLKHEPYVIEKIVMDWVENL